MRPFEQISRSLEQTVSQRGSAALLSMLAVFGGITFALLFLNLTRYVAARGAVDEAARKVARCLSASDGDCSEVTGATVQAASDWYGYAPEQVVDVYAREANYSLQVPVEEFSTAASAVQILSGRHQIQWPEYSVPVRRYVGLLNSYARLRGDTSIRFTAAGSRYRCTLRDAVEVAWGLDFSAPATYFSPSWCSFKGQAVTLPFLANNLSNPAITCEGDLGAAPALTPALVQSGSLYSDADWNGQPCALRLPGSPQKVTDAPSEAQPWLRLGGTPICDSSDSLTQPIPGTPPAASGKGTDGAFPVTVERQYLVVELAVCDEAAALSEVTAQLTTNSGASGKSLDEVLQFFAPVESIRAPGFDPLDFDADPRANLNSSFLYPPVDPETGLLSFIGPSVYDWTYLRWERFANRSEVETLGAVQAQKTYLERRVCYWKEWNDAVASGWTGLRDVPAPPAALRVASAQSCGGASRVTPDPAFTCLNRSSGAPGGDLNHCEGWEAFRAALNRQYAAAVQQIADRHDQQNFERLRSAASPTQFGTEPAAQWAPGFIDPAWTFAWAGVDSEGNKIDPDFVRPAPPVKVSILEPVRKDGSYAGPSLERWLAEIPKQLNRPVHAPGWEIFAERFAQTLAAGAVSRTPAEPIEISGLNPFPFDKRYGLAKDGIELFSASSGGMFDYNLDCSLDAACPAQTAAGGDLESILTAVAGNRIPKVGEGEKVAAIAVADRNENYTHLGTFSGIELEQLRGSLPPCAPVLTSCRRPRDIPGNVPQLLAHQAAAPDACANGAAVDCFAIPTDAPAVVKRAEVRTFAERARARGQSEIARIFPGAELRESCDAAGCSQIAIDESDPARVTVSVSYNLGLDFPFDLILGTKSLAVSGETTERLERAMVGRSQP